MNVLAPTLWAVVLAAAPSPSPRGPGPVIVVVAPPGADPAVTEALNRFKGEAASVGFEVTVVTGSVTATPIAQMESAAHAASAVATVAFVNGGDPHAFDVWFTDRLTGKTVFGHVSVENEAGDRASVVLAVKAVDFLRARMFDFLAARPASLADGHAESKVAAASVVAVAPASVVAVAPASVVAVAPDPIPSAESFRARRIGLSIGVAALRSLQGLGTTVVPLFRGTYDLTHWASLRITLGGLGTSSRVNAMGGGATVAEDVAVGEWVVMPGSARIRPIFSAGAGVHYVHAEGTAVAPYVAHAKGRAVFAGSVSAGLSVILSRRLVLQAEAGSFLLFPEPQVLIAGLQAGRTGRPGLSATIAMEARF